MKTQNSKLAFKTMGITELSNTKLLSVNGGSSLPPTETEPNTGDYTGGFTLSTQLP